MLFGAANAAVNEGYDAAPTGATDSRFADLLLVEAATPAATNAQPSEQNDGSDALSAEGQGQKVNINLASYEQLLALPGIGKVKATAIIKYRKEEGRFGQINDIQNVKGIGNKMFAKLKDLIKI